MRLNCAKHKMPRRGGCTLSFVTTGTAAVAGNLEYFLRHYEKAVAEGNVMDQSVLATYALRGPPKVCAWGKSCPVAELLTANPFVLKMCVQNLAGPGCLQRLIILLGTSGVRDRVLEHATVSVGHLKLVDKVASPDVFCQEACLAREGVALHKAKTHRTLRWMMKRFKLAASDLASVGL